MSKHNDICRARVLARADELQDAIKNGRLNASAFEGLLRSYLDQPAFSATNRDELFAIGYERIVGRRP